MKMLSRTLYCEFLWHGVSLYTMETHGLFANLPRESRPIGALAVRHPVNPYVFIPRRNLVK